MPQKRRDLIYKKLEYFTEIYLNESNNLEKLKLIDANFLSKEVNIARYNVSRDLFELFKQKKVIRIEGRPVYFLSVKEVEKKLGRAVDVFCFKTKLEFTDYVRNNKIKEKDLSFSELIGYKNSLATAVKQAKAAILYPPDGLHTLLTGPTGSGKSVFAKVMYNYAIESHVLRKNAPFIIFNCADYSNNPELLLDHLFGHKKDSFTGASNDKDGIVEKANDGILFLDEIHRFPSEGQEMLFSLMDRGEYFKLGENSKKSHSKILIIAATTEKPSETLLSTFLRRIPVVINMPSLKERDYKERLELIAFFFQQEAQKIKKVLKVSNDVVLFLLQYDCPGNIGQVKNDIKLICANAFVDFVTQKTNEVVIRLSHLSNYMLEQFYTLKSDRERILKEIGFPKTRDIVFYPDDFVNREIIELFEEDHSFYDNLLMMMKQYIDKGFSVDKLKKLVDEKVIKQLENAPKRDRSIFKIISRKNYKITLDILKKISESFSFKIDLNSIQGLALHIDTLLNRLKLGKVEENIPNEKSISQDLMNEKEFRIAQVIQQKLVEKIGVNLPDNEVIFLTLFLKAVNKGKSEKKIGILVMVHGESAATDFANTTNQLLNMTHVNAINMPLTQSVKFTLKKAEEKIKEINEGKGVLILSDMGSLNTFGETISDHTEIPTKTVKMVSTPMVIEAARKSMFPNMTLETLAKDVIELSSYIGNSGSGPNDEPIDIVYSSNPGKRSKYSNKAKLISLLKSSLIFLDPSVVYDYIYEIVLEFVTTFHIKNFDPFWIKFLFHTCFLIERCIRNETFSNSIKDELIADNYQIYKKLKTCFIKLENRYAIEIPDSELAYLIELILLNISETVMEPRSASE